MGFTTAIDLLDAGKREPYIIEHATSGLEQQVIQSVLRDLPNLAKRRHSKLTAPIIRRTPFGSRIDQQAAGRALFPIQQMPSAEDDS